jgi:AcrR family transcriptional regulator
MSRRKVDVRRKQILAATAAEVERKGFAQTRVADVAAALGISPGLVFYHFSSKERLLTSALEYAVERDLARLDAAVASAASAPQRLSQVLRLYAPQGKARGWTLWIDAWAAALRQPQLRRTIRRLDQRWRHALEVVIDDGVRAGDFRCADPAAAAQRLTALMDGLAIQVTISGRVGRRQLAEWTRAAAAAELGTDLS